MNYQTYVVNDNIENQYARQSKDNIVQELLEVQLREEIIYVFYCARSWVVLYTDKKNSTSIFCNKA